MENKDDILKKLRKLMNLHEGAKKINSEDEANAAAAAIQRLLTRYNLSMSDIGEDAAKEPKNLVGSEVFESYSKNIGGYWRYELMYVICKWNFCKCFLYGNRASKKMIVFGEPQNMETVKWMFDMLCKVFVKLGKAKHKAYMEDMSGVIRPMSWDKYLRSYLPGCAKGLDWKFSNESRKMKAESEDLKTKITALVVRKNDAIDRYINNNFGKSKTSQKLPQGSSKVAYEEGFKDGTKVNIFKPIQQSRKAEFDNVKILK